MSKFTQTRISVKCPYCNYTISENELEKHAKKCKGKTRPKFPNAKLGSAKERRRFKVVEKRCKH